MPRAQPQLIRRLTVAGLMAALVGTGLALAGLQIWGYYVAAAAAWPLTYWAVSGSRASPAQPRADTPSGPGTKSSESDADRGVAGGSEGSAAAAAPTDAHPIETGEAADFHVGDVVVYPHHGAGRVVKKEARNILGEEKDYLTIKIVHNDMIVMVPCDNAGMAGLRRIIDEEALNKVLTVLQEPVSEMPKNWNRRFKHNRDKIKTGDIYELAEVARNLALREHEKGLSTGEKLMFTRAKKILASELMYALDNDEESAERYLDEVLAEAGRRHAANPTDIAGRRPSRA